MGSIGSSPASFEPKLILGNLALHVAVSRNRGSFKGGLGLPERVLGLIYGRFRVDLDKNHMAISVSWGSFFGEEGSSE